MPVLTRHTVVRRLLAAPAAGASASYADHLACHGALPVAPGDAGWMASLDQALAASGLVGRGGARFPSAAKLASVRRAAGRPVVVVNAMEGEPASAKDLVLLTACPHLVLDGAEVLAGMAGATRTVVCLEAHSPARAAVSGALAERRSRWAGTVEVSTPPGGYVAGEESALVAWLDGRPGRPQFRPDKSVALRVGRHPALVHNAETLAHVALIARHGPDWFAEAGSAATPGTTLVTVTGDVDAPGVLEVEFGTPVAEILTRAGRRGEEGPVLVGGYAGAWLAPSQLDVPFDGPALAELGAAPGVGVLVALPASACAVAETARLARYMAGESAGQCGPCVFGLPALAGDLVALAHGTGGPDVTDRLALRCATVAGRGACRHPDGVVRLVQSLLTVFADDVAQHRAGRPCAGCSSPTWMTFPARPHAEWHPS